MTKVNIDKFKKHQKLVYDSRNKDEIPEDAYGIDVALTSWALNNISTKELKRLIKQESK